MHDFRWWSYKLWRILHKETRRWVPFEWNAIQEAAWRRHGELNVVAKPRQVGFSTFGAARVAHRAFTEKNFHGLITAHKKATAIELLRRIHRGYGAMPAAVTVGDHTFPTKPKLYRASDNELIFVWDWKKENPQEFSTITLATAGGEWSIGRGFTFDHILITEAGMPEYHNGQAFNAAINALIPGGEAWMESSPKGAAGPMYRYFKDALNQLNDWIPHFPRFTDYPQYRRELKPGEPAEPVNEFEQELMEKYDCDLEAMLFARFMVKNKMAEGKQDPIEAFHEEYPIDPDRCWLVQGDMFFPVEVVTAGIERARRMMDKESPEHIDTTRYRVYHAWESKHEIREEKLGPWHLIEMPKRDPRTKSILPGNIYAITADSAKGGKDGDSSVAAVWHKEWGRPLRNIGFYKDKVTVPRFARQIFAVWKWFGMPLIIPESNFHGEGLILALQRLGIHNIYRMRKRDQGRLYSGFEAHLGFESNKHTRPRALELLTESTEIAHSNPESRYGLWSPFPEFWDQARTFVYNASGRPEAAPGSEDDYVTCAWIAAYCFFDERSGLAASEPSAGDEGLVLGQEIPPADISYGFKNKPKKKRGQYR
jgi:hypothetical protein